jgi:hypothetical protein
MIAEIKGGQDVVDIINTLRSRHDLPEFQSVDPTEIRDQVREERFRELWLRGTRLGDMRRWGLQFPSGANLNGNTYGPYTCWPIPEAESFNNPNL